MATKLYPPQIDGILPAFYKIYNADTGQVEKATIEIPFGLNRAVALKDIGDLRLRIKTVSTNTQVYIGSTNEETGTKNWDKTNLIAYFTIPSDIAKEINEGQFYKAQLAFVDNQNIVGYWSTVGTLKCVAKPKVSIANFDEAEVNGFTQEFVGEYQQDMNFGDSTEKVETYEFNIWDMNNELILSSGIQLHNSADDISSTESTDIFKTNYLIKEGQMYYIQYSVVTMNNLNISSPIYKIMQTESVDIEYPLELHCNNNFENGYIELYLQGQIINGKEQMYNGTFLITRGSDKDDYFEWNEIIRFNMDTGYPSDYSFRDFTVEQGITYKYRIQQYNTHKLYSNPIYLTKTVKYDDGTEEEVETDVVADFEDMFIYDGKRQLKVRFNPKVTSFKNTIPEQKVETIGSKYPFIFRNGHVNYKEFPISGLIAYSMDEAMLFLNSVELEEAKILEPTYIRDTNYASGHTSFIQKPTTDLSQRLHEDTHRTTTDGAATIVYNTEKIWVPGVERVYKDTNSLGERVGIKDRVIRQDKNLTTENLMGERYFKLKVLDWLTNGEVKLFRSPGEGNYLVRILNVSMTPNDTLGRMLHTFTGTCYEIDNLTYNNLIHYGIVTENEITLTETHGGAVNLNTLTGVSADGFYSIPLSSNIITRFSCDDCMPGDIIKVIFTDNDVQYIYIGNTGAYNYSYDDRAISSLEFKPNPEYTYVDYSRTFYYEYEGIQSRKFDSLSDINTKTQIAKQYIGPYENVMEPYSLSHDGAVIADPLGTDASLEFVTEQIQRHPNIRLSDNVIKFDVLQAEILHAQARPLIPVFALGGVDEQTRNTRLYSLTPFGNGYVNYHSIYVDEDTHIETLEANVVEKMLQDNKLYINAYDIEDINFNLEDNIPTPIDAYSILQVFVPASNTDGQLTSWEPTNYYYDTYTHNWYNDYQPYFSVTDDETGMTTEILKKDINGRPLVRNNKLVFDTETDSYGNEVKKTKTVIDNNTNKIYLDDIEDVTFYNLGQINKLEIGNGAMVEITFQLQVVDYSIELENQQVFVAREAYLNIKNNYLKELANYYKQLGDMDLQNIDKDLLAIAQNILFYAEHVAPEIIENNEYEYSINYNNEEHEIHFSVETTEAGIPKLSGEGEYQKIINDIQKVIDKLTDAYRLKIQMTLLQQQLITDLLSGWVDEENNTHKGLLDLPPYYFGTENPYDTSELSNWYNYMVNENSFDDYTIGQIAYFNNNVLTCLNRWVPSSVTLNEDYRELYEWPGTEFNSKAEMNAILATDNTMNIIVEDRGYQDVINAILYRINGAANFNHQVGTLIKSESITADEYTTYSWSWQVNDRYENYTNANNTVKEFIDSHNQYIPFYYVVEDGYSRIRPDDYDGDIYYRWSDYYLARQNLHDYNSLNSYITTNLNCYNLLRNFSQKQQVNMIQTIDMVQQNNIALLYLLAHTPVPQMNGVPDTIQNIFGQYQNNIEIDYAANSDFSLELINELVVRNNIMSVLTSKMVKTEEATVVIHYDEETDIIVNEDNINDYIPYLTNAVLENDNFYSHDFWHNKTGGLVEVKDDLYIAYKDLIVSYIPYQCMRLYEELATSARETIGATPYGDYTIEEYLNILTGDIARYESDIADWTAVLNQTNKLLETDSNNEELQKLKNTAMYNIQVDEMLIEVAQNNITTFQGTTVYQQYGQAQQQEENAIEKTQQYKINYDIASAAFTSKTREYELLLSFIKALLISNNNSNIFRDNKDKIFNLLAHYVNYINSNNITLDTLDTLLNFYSDNNILHIDLGYFTLLELSDNIPEDNEGIIFNYDTYYNHLLDYMSHKNDLLNHYQDMLQQIQELQEIYNTRATFAASLKNIQDTYEKKINDETITLLGLINDLRKLQKQLESLNTNKPSDDTIKTIKLQLTRYLLTLQQYYIAEVERRYSV